MGLFSKKKEEEKISILEEQDKIKKIVEQYQEEEHKKKKTPLERKVSLESREFREFRESGAKAAEAKTHFEKAARFAGRYLQIKMKEKDSAKLEEVLYFIDFAITPGEVTSLSILSLLLSIVLAGVFALVYFPLAIAFIAAGLFLLLFIPYYPKYLKRAFTVDMLNTMPLAITYMVIYMRSQPTLEGAVRFASKHLTGPLARDLRKLLWDLETGVYLSMDEALGKYASQWQEKNNYFATSLEVLRNSEKTGNEEERLRALDEAARVILQGNLNVMQKFSRGLRMPIMVLYMLGVVLPVMGLVIAPIMATLMTGGLSGRFLIIVYNILLPLILYGFIKWVLSSRPGAFTTPDINDYPGLPKEGYMKLGEGDEAKEIPLALTSILLFLVISAPGLWLLTHFPEEAVFSMFNIFLSMTPVWGITAAIVFYTSGGSKLKLKIRKDVERTEEDLDEILNMMGDRLSRGTPIEAAIAEIANTVKAGPMRELFARARDNMQKAGMPLENALFDPEVGALRYTPSKQLSTIMEVLVESSRKGLAVTSTSMRTIGQYLQNLKVVRESIEDMVSKTVSAMKFQAQFLTSFIAGVIIALNVLLFKILIQLGGKLGDLELPNDVGGAGVAGVFENSFFNVASAVPSEIMQLIVGVYMIQVTILLSLLITGVNKGRDTVSRNHEIGSNLLISTIVYTIAVTAGIILFSGFAI